MEANGDITDAFDDEDLKRSIEAGEQGPWNDEQARFRDPKLEELDRQLKQREIRGYRERRLAELKAQGMRERRQQAEAKRQSAARRQRPKPARDNPSSSEPTTFGPLPQWGEPATFSDSAPTGKPEPRTSPRPKAPWNRDDSPPAPPPAADWPDQTAANQRQAEPAATRDSVPGSPFESPTRSDKDKGAASLATAAPAEQPVLAEAEAADTGDNKRIRGPVESSVMVAYAPSVFASTLVFVAATLVHGSLEGWRSDLIYRAVIAMLVTGILWRRCQSGRLRAMTIAVTVYLTGFITSNRLDRPESQVALFLGLLVVVAGSGLIGVQRDEFGEQTL